MGGPGGGLGRPGSIARVERMELTINGKPERVPDGTTLRALIERLGLGKSACAAEVNQRLVPRREHESTPLADGDRVELVTLVGGG